jgi:hypothetical protein
LLLQQVQLGLFRDSQLEHESLRESRRIALHLLVEAYAKLMLVMLVGGALVWLALRARRVESGGRFAIAGGLMGMAACFVFGGTGPSWQSPASLTLISFCGVVGAATALLSWLIAQSPD